MAVATIITVERSRNDNDTRMQRAYEKIWLTKGSRQSEFLRGDEEYRNQYVAVGILRALWHYYLFTVGIFDGGYAVFLHYTGGNAAAEQ